MKRIAGKLSKCVSLLMAAVLCVQYMPVAVTAEAASMSDFGDGSDGALHIAAGQTVTLPVPVPHQSVVEMNYTSVYIEAGGVLRCADYNAGLVIRATGDVTINGTIDQRGKAPKTNPNNNYSYPPELVCGEGGTGGGTRATYSDDQYTWAQVGGQGQSGRKYGGGYSGGGAGGASGANLAKGGRGGDANAITVHIPNIFVGGAQYITPGYGSQGNQAGAYGGGGTAGSGQKSVYCGAGGSGAGGNGESYITDRYVNVGGGGAGNAGGGIVIIYARGNFTLGGSIDCAGASGGAGGNTYGAGTGGGGGGGGGGGAIYVMYCGQQNVTGSLNAQGGYGGNGGVVIGSGSVQVAGDAGAAGTAGTVSVAKAPDVTPPAITGVTVSTSWGLTNSATITATDDMSGIVSYAVTGSSAVPSNGSWQSGSCFTLSANGTYYAWAKDAMGNVNAGYSFTVSKIDNAAPVVNSATVNPTGWTGSSAKTITVTATDSQSGIAEYGISTANTAPTTWQSGNTFSKAAGTYYLWAKDNVGNVSVSRQATVDNIDTTAPVVTSAVVTPGGWTGGSTKTITVTATDSQSGIAEYGITTANTAPTTWQWGNTFSKAAGIYYLWAKDNVGNVSASRQVSVENLDDVKPVISGVTLPSSWGQSNTAVVNGSDMGSGVNIYAVSSTNGVPGDGWQSGSSFTLSANGTYYAWCKDKVGNISDSFSFVVSKVDTELPTITDVSVTPAGWAESGVKTITVTAADSRSGILGYGITTTTIQPRNWQDDGSFSKPLGSYYLWVKDNAGNVSAYRQVKVENVDDVKPVISGVTLPSSWGQTNTAVISAADVGKGLKDYAVTADNVQPGDGWQDSNSFILSTNGTYYAWARDKAGNVSESFSFEVNRVDTEVPVITDAAVTPAGWVNSGIKTITVTATDSQSGVAEYGITTTAAAPTYGWQTGNTFKKSPGSYYLWARDSTGRVSAVRPVVVENLDDVKPVISGVTLPESWGQSNTAVINASDVGNGLKDYAVSRENSIPGDGWQTERSFTLAYNGTYYAWARDNAGNVSDSFSFEVGWVDTEVPVIGVVAVTPVGWTDSSTKTITVTATDTQSGVTHYGITETGTAPTAWQIGNTFAKPTGSYYLWARDKSGRVSEPMQVVVDGIDTDKPIVTGVEVTPGWNTTAKVLISATDSGSGIKEYAVSEYRFAPGTGWQTDASFTLDKNGSYYAFARDSVGNTSEGLPFTLDKVDTAKPAVSRVIIAPGFSSCVTVELEATDVGSGVKDYAVSDSSSAPAEGWQSTTDFTIEKNGSYYAFARDMVNNISAGKFFNITKVDKQPPIISSIGYSSDNSTIMIRGSDNESSVVCIYIDGTAYPGSTVSWDVVSGTRYIKLQAEDEAGNRSKEETHRVRGWHDLLDSITIEPVEFKDDNRKAVITGKTTGEGEITGIYINGRLQDGNPVTYMVSAGMEYLELQAEDAAGDRSKLYRVRVPGWSQEIAALSIVDVRFAQDSSSAQVTAMSTSGVEVRGIRVNGELQAGNPITYEIPAGTTHLKMQAEDMNGDRSAVLIRRVPGWSEVVTTLTVTDVTFTDYNTTAQITATATGGDSVSGIIVNEKAYEGNPIVYTVPKDTETLHIQAYNPQGDKSPMVNKAVPMDSSKSTLKLSIEHPEWTKSRSARVKLVAEDKNRITKILVRTGEDSEWADVTEKRYIDIAADTAVYATVENDKGEVKEVSEDIECFDRTAPTVTATQDGKTINIRTTDNKSGVTSILVNNKEYQRGDFEDGKLAYRIPEGTTMVIIKAEDAAGNLSRAVELPIENTVAALPVIITPTPAPTPKAELLPEEAAIPEHEPVPTPKPEPEIPEQEPPVIEAAAEPEPLPPGARAAVAAGGVGSTAIGGIWYWLRKKAMSKPIEELELLGKKLLYDESEFGGSNDPLDKTSGKEDM